MTGGMNDYILECVEDGIIVVDGDLVVRVINHAAERTTGLSRQGAVGRSIAEVFKANPHLAEQLGRTLESGQTSLSHEAPLRLRDGSTRYISLTCSPVSNPAGDRLGVAAVFKDMTVIRDLEERGRHSDGLTRLGTMAAGIAHEVKNPLGGIRGAAQILRNALVAGRTEGATLIECADLVIQQVDRIDRLIEDLLDLGSPKKPRIGPVNVNKVLNDLVQLLRAELDEEAVTFDLGFDPSLPPVRGDEERLTQVFLNLLRNALDALRERPRGGKVSLRSRFDLNTHPGRSDHSPRPMIAVEIEDNGPGIRAEDLEKLFTPYFTTKARGSGLGLAVSHKLVEDHGGAIKVSSVHGKGTRVKVLLPAEESE